MATTRNHPGGWISIGSYAPDGEEIITFRKDDQEVELPMGVITDYVAEQFRAGLISRAEQASYEELLRTLPFPGIDREE